MLTGLSRRVRELGRGDRDRYACCYVGDESKGRGRLNWTVGRSPSAREACVFQVYLKSVGKGLKKGAAGEMNGRPTAGDILKLIRYHMAS